MPATKHNLQHYRGANVFLRCPCGGTWSVDILAHFGANDIPVCPDCFQDVQIAEALTVIN